MGSWDSLIETCTAFYDRFFLKTKNNDLIKFCTENNLIRKSTEIFLERKREEFISKNPVIADEKRKKANLLKNKKENIHEVLSLYSNSILQSNKNDKHLSLTFWSRSKILLDLGCVEEALQDINIALSLDCPKTSFNDFVIQKYKCLLMVGDGVGAKNLLHDAFENHQNKKLLKNLEVEVQSLKNVTVLKPIQFEVPELAGGINENFVFASKFLQLHYTKNKGRHVLATHDIQIGEVLFVEKPFAFVLVEDMFCNKCCKKLISLIPCWHCTEVFYCSPNCRDSHWKKVHSFECGSNEIFKIIGIAHLSLRILLAASSSVQELRNIVNNIKKTDYQEGNISFTNSGYESVYNLVTNSEKYESADLFQYTMAALLLALHLKNYTPYFGDSSKDEDLTFVTSVLLRHILQLICNGHAIVDTFYSRSKELVLNETEKRKGTAIYPSTSMMNHSCEPSVINSFYDDCLVVRAVKDIKKGEEVYNCYGPHARRMERLERHKILSQQYFFDCKCTACTQPFDIQDAFTALKCENCKGPLTPKDENKRKAFCIDCQQVFEISEKLAEKENLFFLTMKEGETLSNTENDYALTVFLNSWLLGREIFYKFNKNLCQAADEVAKCLACAKNYKLCIRFLKCCILSVEKRFGSNSIETANEIKKLGDVICNYVDDLIDKGMEAKEEAMEGMRHYKKAQQIISLLFGPNHPTVKEIDQNEAYLERMLKLYK